MIRDRSNYKDAINLWDKKLHRYNIFKASNTYAELRGGYLEKIHLENLMLAAFVISKTIKSFLWVPKIRASNKHPKNIYNALEDVKDALNNAKSMHKSLTDESNILDIFSFMVYQKLIKESN